MAKFLYLAICLLLSLSGRAQLPLLARLVRQPAARPTGLPTPTGHATHANVPWVVYSDRANNPTYREANLAVKFKQIPFRQACYVLAERQGFLRLVQYDPALKIGTFYAQRLLKSRKAAKYLGWVPKNRLLLASQAPVDSAGALPTLYCPALTSSRVLQNTEQFFRHDSLRLFAQPDLTSQLPKRLKLYDLAYVYKFSESGREALLGAADWFGADSAATYLLGWAPTTALQLVGQGWFLEPDTVHRTRPDYRLYASPTAAWQGKPDSLARPSPAAKVAWASKGVRLPVLQSYRRDNSPVVAQLGLLSPLLVPGDSVLSVDGTIITRRQYARWRDKSRIYNIVYVLEDSPAMQKHWPEVVSTVQTTVGQLQDSVRQRIVRMGAVLYHSHSRGSGLAALPLSSNLARLAGWLNQHRPSSTRAGTGWYQPTQQGLAAAFRLLDNHKGENNLVILVGIDGDSRDVAQLKSLRSAEARLLCFQVAAPPDTVANNFVLQAQQLVIQSARQVGLAKRERLVSPRLVIPRPSYEMRSGTQNIIYRLAFPKQSMVPGWVLFPIKERELPISLLLASTTSMLAQLRYDATQTMGAMDQAFAAALPLRSRLDPQIGRTLLARREPPVAEASVAPALVALQAYPFYRQAYVPISQSDTTFRQLRLLTPDAYAVLGQWLDLLAADALNPAHTRDRNKLTGYFRQLIAHVGPTLSDTAALALPLSRLLGLPVRHPLLTQLRFSDLTTPGVMPAGVWARLLYLLRERRDYYQRVPAFANSRFTSNGRTYYWLSEDLFR
ncbi:MAG: type VI secretion system protein TssR domain-containing protein [Janthinobacterium lividum]